MINERFEKNTKKTFFEEEIDFKFFLNLLLRNKYFIGIITFTFFVISCLIALAKQKVWEGEFEIVLSNKKSNRLPLMLESNANFLRMAGINLNESGEPLRTEVGILESSSVLMPIFENVKSKKISNNANYDLSFSDWKESNLKVNLKEGTSILNITYRDVDKDLIIPVLKQMSDTYQIYSGKNKKRNLNLAKEYLNNQILIYEEESSKSLRKVQEYAIDKDLVFYDPKDFSLNAKSSDVIGKNNIFDFQNIGIGASLNV